MSGDMRGGGGAGQRLCERWEMRGGGGGAEGRWTQGLSLGLRLMLIQAM